MSADAVSEPLASLLSTCTSARLWAEQDEGPYHRDAQPLRRDIVEDRDGIALQLGIRLAGSDSTPVGEATVEIWQCDALGRYAGFPPPDDAAVVTAADAPRGEYLPDQTFLRGRQLTNAAGMVEFGTIYPGWYPGRTVHIHVMVHARSTTLTSQLYFADEISDRVLSLAEFAGVISPACRDTDQLGASTDDVTPRRVGSPREGRSRQGSPPTSPARQRRSVG